ncbi:MMPL/RND family transporter [Mycobacteroides abscessus]|uniref:MMPL/RND family transporter n=1 Tax=Mycobacteroides abscessus TaxID=36809 RepID=UPI000928BE3A|nr:membrane protein mmpL1 [Mycobacteroides abscessus subsp. bolletii]SHR68253.1 membrane protein mmpL1 [Mycobacteroides abscessus subsp. bolletii]SHS15596.1 membrane protein mmpL1 [Mycobacteroides abscessus subsp. bolletii]SKF76191.1 membrane protein mmpL1 [Mycobacteroides abscessus subsp. bolletii]SKF79211.1 membrane protein mmpL1 [Mycobacteroides abscessus subsp. bolletii]
MTPSDRTSSDDDTTKPVLLPQPSPQQDVQQHQPLLARMLRVLSIPVVILWLFAAVAVTIFIPSLEQATEENAQAMVPRDTPSSQAALVQGGAFKESEFTGAGVIVLETHGRKLGNQDREYYNGLVRRLRQDSEHVQGLLDLWGDRVTMSGQQSADAEAATLTVWPAGDTADAESSKSIAAIRKIVADIDKDKPEGLNVYVSGGGPLSSDTLKAADESMAKLTIVTIVVIVVMLLLAYRSITRALIPLFGVLVCLTVARGVVALCVELGIVGTSSYAMNMVVALVLGVATDYGIFFLGRYQEARCAGHDTESAYYTAVEGTWHVIVGSGIAISGATLCLGLTKLTYFKTLGPPCFVAMMVAVVAALTLGPALLAIGSRLPWLNKPVRMSRVWRKLGTIIAKWPAPLIAVAALLIPLALGGLAIYKVSYNDRDFAPFSTESVQGYIAADRHFQKSQISTDVMYVQADHDMRNTTDMITLDRIAKNIIRVPGIVKIQSITRPNGRPMEHASLPYAMGFMGTKIGQNIDFLKDRAADIDKMAATMGDTIETTKRIAQLTQEMAEGTHISLQGAQEMKAALDKTRDSLANFDDFFRPFRNYLYWEPHCFDIPVCFALRSLNESIDGIDESTEALTGMVDGLTVLDRATPQLVTQLDETVRSLTTLQQLTLTMQGTLHATITQMEPLINPMVDMAKAFDNAKNDDFFFMSPDTFKTNDFVVGLKFFVTQDGRGARLMIFHEGEAMSPEGIDQIRKAEAAAQEALKGTSLEGAKLFTSGASSTYRDIADYSFNDIMLMMVATFSLVFLIVMFLTGTLAGAVMVTIAVVLSFAGALGLSTLIWEGIFGVQLHWLTLPIAFIVLVGVGCDYNLLLLSRYREELHAGVSTGLIRTVAGSGNVAIIAAFVLAGTMAALLSSDVVSIGMAGSTIAMGLIFDMFVVRLLLVMPMARILGAWFWWPRKMPTPQKRVTIGQ